MLERILQWDKELFLFLNFDGSQFWDSFFWAVSGKLIWIPLYLLIVWLLYRKYGLRDTVIALFCIVLIVAVSDQISNFFKDHVPKLRPTHNPEFAGLISLVKGYRGALTGTVSAHAAISFGITTFTSLLLRNRWYVIFMVLWALLIAYSRIYIGAHYPLDILFGILTGVSAGFLVKLLYVALVKWFDSRNVTKEHIGK